MNDNFIAASYEELVEEAGRRAKQYFSEHPDDYDYYYFGYTKCEDDTYVFNSGIIPTVATWNKYGCFAFKKKGDVSQNYIHEFLEYQESLRKGRVKGLLENQCTWPSQNFWCVNYDYQYNNSNQFSVSPFLNF